jgi:hypothetical protein
MLSGEEATEAWDSDLRGKPGVLSKQTGATSMTIAIAPFTPMLSALT